MKNNNIVINTIVAGAIFISTSSTMAKEVEAACAKALKKDNAACQIKKNLGDFKESKKDYSLLTIDCKEGDFENSQFVLVSKAKKDSCEILDMDTSFVGYASEVDADLKSNQPKAVYEKAMLAEVNFIYPSKEEKLLYLKRLEAREKVNDLTPDLKWIMNQLKTSL